MRSRKLFTRQKAKNGEGRQVVIKHLLLPEEVINELRLYKDAYSACLSREKDEWGNPVPVQVTWEQMLRRWMDNVGRFDKDVKDYVESGKAYLADNPPAPVYPVYPTEGEICKMRHFFERDGEELDAIPGDLTPFYAVKDGRNVGMKQLFADGWVLMNDAGVELDYDQAVEVSRILKEHRGPITVKSTHKLMGNIIKVKVDWDGHNYASCPENENIACVVTSKTLDGIKSEMTDALHQHINWMKEDGDDIPEEFRGEWEIEWVLTASAQLQYAETFKGTPEGMPYRPLNV